MKQQSVITADGLFRYAARLFNQELQKAAKDGWSTIGDLHVEFHGWQKRKYHMWIKIERDIDDDC